MRTFLCFLWLILLTTLFAESFQDIQRRDLLRTIKLLHALGPKQCLEEVGNAQSGRFTSYPKKTQEKHLAVKISYNSTFELFKKKTAHGHWKHDAFQNLMEHLYRHAQPTSVPVVSSELETLVKDFTLLDHFLTQQNFSRCAWEIARNEVLLVMDHLCRKTAHRKRHN